MIDLIPILRTVTSSSKDRGSESASIASFRNLDAYVLLGEPGSGKTTVFKQEAEELGDAAIYLPVRDFLTAISAADCSGKILFVDALDERRSVLGTKSAPLDEVRARLLQLGKPRFRLSCREADWLSGGAQDLSLVAPSGSVLELRLDRLSKADIRKLLEAWLKTTENTVDDFLAEAERHDLGSLLGSPLLLKLLSSVVGEGNWPKSRAGVYALACKRMAQEHNPRHRDSQSMRLVAEDELLEAAGKLSSLLLLSDSPYITRDPDDCGDGGILTTEIPSSIELDSNALAVALDSKLFGAEGERYAPWHRTIAEYLGGKAIAMLVMERGLPIRRVLAIMTSEDGGVPDSLRGLFGWMTVHCLTERELLIRTDPVGLVLYGDVRDFTTAQKKQILDAIANEATRYPWFRSEHRHAHPFGALGTKDMAPELQRLLALPARDMSQEAVIECVLDAVVHGEAMPDLACQLKGVLEDSSHSPRVRRHAAAAWLRCISYESQAVVAVLDDILSGKLVDDDDEITGRILTATYPAHVTAQAALRYFHAEKVNNLIGWYHMFWATNFVREMPDDQIAAALASLQTLVKQARPEDTERAEDFERRTAEISRKLLLHALERIGESASDEDLYQWMGLRLNTYGVVDIRSEEQQRVDDWLSARPHRMKALLLCGVESLNKADKTVNRTWLVKQRLHGARRPKDWYRWLLEEAKGIEDPDFARHWVQSAAEAAVHEAESFDISLDDVWAWALANSERWPDAVKWVEDATTYPLDDWRGEDHRRNVGLAEAASNDRANRRVLLEPMLPKIFEGIGPPWAMGEIAMAHSGDLREATGTDPLDRVANYLGGTEDEAERAVTGLRSVLARKDLPTINDIKGTSRKGRRNYLSYACLLAAELEFQENADVVTEWSLPAVEALTGFQSIDEYGAEVGWFEALCARRPAAVLHVLQSLAQEDAAFATPRLRTHYTLQSPHVPQEFVRQLLPGLVNVIPKVPSPEQLRLFNEAFVPAARRHLDEQTWRVILEDRIDEKGVSLEFFVALHTASIELAPEEHFLVLKTLTDIDPDIALQIRDAVQKQAANWSEIAAQRPEMVGWLVELLAGCALACGDHTRHEKHDPFDSRGRVIYNSLKVLSGISSRQAGVELHRLRDLTYMEPWRTEVNWCIGKQQLLHRATMFSAPPMSAVVAVLANRAPASARDMAVLMIDQMTRLAEDIRFTEANQLDLFWQTDGKGGKKPQSENHCRNVLLGLIRSRLQLQGVTLGKESPAAADMRADLQGSALVRGQLVVVPVEIKKEDHSNVWSAWWDQLEARYMSNPAASGVGIYIVLWFGYAAKRHPSGVRPMSAEQAAAMFSADIPIDRKDRIFGLVVDLSSR